MLVVPFLRMEAKQVLRRCIRLAYSPPIVIKHGRARPGYVVGWTFDAAVIALLVVFATLSLAA